MKLIEKSARKRLAKKVQIRIRASGRIRVRLTKSNRYLTAHLFNANNRLLFSAKSADLVHTTKSFKNKDAARILADRVAEMCSKRQWKGIVLDRSIYKYHGVVSEFAEALRSREVLL